MSLGTVAIELLYDRMDVAAIKGGRVLVSKRFPSELPTDGLEWIKAVRSIGTVLEPIVQELGLSGAQTSILYRSPTQAVDLASFEIRSSSEACTAAILTCSESLPYSASTAVIEAVVVGRDRAGTAPKTHVAVAAERTDAVRAMVEMVESAGLKFSSAAPIDVPIMVRILRQVLKHSGPQQGWLHFGEHSSLFVVGGGGAIRFERSIAIGLRTIARSLTRPIRLPGGDEIVELDFDSALKILHRHGIPDADEVVHHDPELTRRHIMPLIQPVLQRYIVELRQSIRFGVPDEGERKAIAITVTGPGSAIPGLASLVGWELRLDVKADEKYSGYDYLLPAATGSELVEAIEDPQILARLNLVPSELAERRQLAHRRRWLWAGAAVALVAIGTDALRISAKLGDAQREAAALAGATASQEKLEVTRARLIAGIRAMDELDETIADSVGGPIRLGAVLHEFSRIIPSSVGLTAMQFRREGQVMTGRISGRAVPIEISTNRTELEPFIDLLKSSPLFENIVLSNVEVSPGGPSSGLRFDASFTLVVVAQETARKQVAVGKGSPRQ